MNIQPGIIKSNVLNFEISTVREKAVSTKLMPRSWHWLLADKDTSHGNKKKRSYETLKKNLLIDTAFNREDED